MGDLYFEVPQGGEIAYTKVKEVFINLEEKNMTFWGVTVEHKLRGEWKWPFKNIRWIRTSDPVHVIIREKHEPIKVLEQWEKENMQIKVDDLEDKWSSDSPDEPICASCEKKIQKQVPIRFWRKDHTEELVLCQGCFRERSTEE